MTGKHRAPDTSCPGDPAQCVDDVCRASDECAWPPDDRVLVSRRALLDAVPCECGPEYSERNLIAPDCRHHDLLDVLDVRASADVEAQP